MLNRDTKMGNNRFSCFCSGVSGRFLFGNQHACNLYGVPMSKLAELTPGDVSPEFQPCGRPSSELARENFPESASFCFDNETAEDSVCIVNGPKSWSAPLVDEQDKLARFEQSIMPHMDAAYNLARWLTTDDSDAQDVVQDAFLKLFALRPPPREVVRHETDRAPAPPRRGQPGRRPVDAGQAALEALGGGAQELAPAAPEVEDVSTRQVAREPEDARDERRPEAATAGEPLVALPNLRVRELVPGLQHAGDPVASAASERPTIRPSRYRIRYAPRST